MRDFLFNGITHIATPLTSQLLEDYNISFILTFSPPESVFIDEARTFSFSQIHTTGINNGKILFVNKYEPDGYFALFYTKQPVVKIKLDLNIKEVELDFFDSEVVAESLSVIEAASRAVNRERSVFNLFYTIETKRLKNNNDNI